MDQKNDGPTVFDINKPNTYGATPSARPIITGHEPTAPDPMVTPQPTPSPSDESKINVKVNKSSDLPAGRASPLAVMEGEPLQSPPFKPDGDSESAAQRAPYMPVSDLTGISQTNSSSKESAINDGQVTTEPKPSVFGESSRQSLSSGGQPRHRRSRTKLWLWPLLILILLAAVYAAVDKDLILKNLNLPVHIFKQVQTTNNNNPTATPSPQTTVPSGFTATKLVEAGLTFAYPTKWGAPTATTDLGFAKRSSSAKPDVNYALLVNFPNNKDIQIAITSGKYLPPARPTQYHDFLGWCVGTADQKFYAGVLRFSTDADKNDTPTTVTCDQGPLNNVAKLNADTIEQTNIKNAEGGLLGDIYTKNLTNTNYVVARVKDASQKNHNLIQTMLGTFRNLSAQ